MIFNLKPVFYIRIPICVLFLLFLQSAEAKSKPSSYEDADHTNLDTLQLVQILYRHGDRTPTRSYPTDPYANSRYWPQGVGQLTDIGKIQHYNLGKYFRRRYDGFLSRTYIPHEMYVLASDMDRTIMSAEVNLAGLYEPTDSHKNWNPTIPWTPVPVRTIAHQEDNLLRTTKPCPKYYRLYSELMGSDYVQNLNKENQELVDYIAKNTGVNGDTLGDVVGIEDVLYIARVHNYTLPGWADKILDKFHHLAAQYFALATHTTEMKRLKGGPLWKVFLRNMQTMSEKLWRADSKPKFFVYSAHDSTITRLMNTLGVYDGIMPTYAAAFIVELHKIKNNTEGGDYFVQMYYRNETWSPPYPMQVPGCPSPCSLTNLIEATAPVIPEDWESECRDGFKTTLHDHDVPVLNQAEGYTVLTQAFGIVGALVVVIGFLLYVSRNKINFELFKYRMPLPGSRIRQQDFNSYDAI